MRPAARMTEAKAARTRFLRCAAQAAAILMLALVGCAGGAREEMVIGSWNMENLGDSRGRDGPSDVALASGIAAAVVASRAAAVAVQEVHDTDADPATRTNSILDRVVAHLNADHHSSWDYRLYPVRHEANRPEFRNQQLTGLLWNRRRLTLDEAASGPAAIEAADEPCPAHERGHHVWDRRPLVLPLSAGEGRTDFVLIVVHMKATDRAVAQEHRTHYAEHRAREASVLLAHLSKTLAWEFDTVVVGDFNCASTSEPAVKKLCAAGLRDLAAADTPTWFGGSDSLPLDRALVGEFSKELSASRWDPAGWSPKEKPKGEKLSDHALVLFTIEVGEDDDPIRD